MQQTSAIPDIYYFFFAAYEPFLTIAGFMGTLFDPQATHNAQAPWPPNNPPPDSLPRATLVTVIQLAHVCALIGVVNFFVLTAARKHLQSQPALQEKIVFSLLAPLLVGDFLHLYLTVWTLGDQKWDVCSWSPMLWTTIVLGLTLMIPRIAWHVGIGRYVESRDGICQKSSKGADPQLH